MIGARIDVCADNSSTERPASLRAVARVSPTDTDDLPGHQGIWQLGISRGIFGAWWALLQDFSPGFPEECARRAWWLRADAARGVEARTVLAVQPSLSTATHARPTPPVADQVRKVRNSDHCSPRNVVRMLSSSSGCASTSRALAPSLGPTIPRLSMRSIRRPALANPTRSLRCSIEVDPNCVLTTSSIA